MKLGLMTIHHAKYSYGAVLQALAMAKICQKWCPCVEIIDYENPYEQHGPKVHNASFFKQVKIYGNYLARQYIFGARNNPYQNSKVLDRLYGCVSKQKYMSLSDLNSTSYDILVCGSDQIWNPQIMGKIDPAFLLGFGMPQKRISYAASMGSYVLTDSDKTVFKKYLKSFYAIGVREQHAQKQISPLVDKNIKLTLDPTLLLRSQEWDAMLKCDTDWGRHLGRPYILTFFVWTGFSSFASEVACYAHALGLPVWNVQSHSWKPKGVDKVIQAPTVGNFLALVKNASLVITNSFHGVAFSLNFEKPFVHLPNKTNPTRVRWLLTQLDLMSAEKIAPSEALEVAHYKRVTPVLDGLRKDSLDWFEMAVRGD